MGTFFEPGIVWSGGDGVIKVYSVRRLFAFRCSVSIEMIELVPCPFFERFGPGLLAFLEAIVTFFDIFADCSVSIESSIISSIDGEEIEVGVVSLAILFVLAVLAACMSTVVCLFCGSCV